MRPILDWRHVQKTPNLSSAQDSSDSTHCVAAQELAVSKFLSLIIDHYLEIISRVFSSKMKGFYHRFLRVLKSKIYLN